ncbi:MAG: ClpX C4-type zinc finger protein [Chloroflexota bacterium]|nr:MAG: hypothetical protein DLM70_03930 [Chloroflexota bacterium]
MNNATPEPRIDPEGHVHGLLDRDNGESSKDPLVAAVLELVLQQGANLRSLEALVLDLQRQSLSADRRGGSASSTRATPAGTTVVRGRRSTDQCSFCGKSSAEAEAIFSSPNGMHICTECMDNFNALRG